MAPQFPCHNHLTEVCSYMQQKNSYRAGPHTVLSSTVGSIQLKCSANFEKVILSNNETNESNVDWRCKGMTASSPILKTEAAQTGAFKYALPL